MDRKLKSTHTEKLYEKLAAHLYACIISKNKCSHIYEASKLQIEFDALSRLKKNYSIKIEKGRV